MRDSDMVAAIVAGDPAGLAAAYDRYAAALHAYCRSLLSEPADAADAVQDTFIIAAAKVGGLRDRERLRPWLYAVARNECHRRLRARGTSADLDQAGDVTDESADVAATAERAELRELVGAAIAGLNPGEREVIELNLRHELDGADLADALGISRNHAHALASRARGQFETSLGALLVARSGRAACPDLDDLLVGWDGRLTILLRKRINRHIEHCDVCGERKRHELRPAMLLGLLPVVAIPNGLRQQVLRLVSADTPREAAYRGRVVRRAEPFGSPGFPVPIDPPGPVRAPRRYALIAGAAAVAFAVLGATAITATLLFGSGPGHAASAGRHTAAASAVPQPPAAASPSPDPTAHSNVPSTPGTAPATILPPTSPPVQPTQPAQPTPRRSPTTRPSPSPSPTTVRPTPPGTLTAAPATVVLTVPPNGGFPTGSFTLTASGGPVANYTITVPAADAPNLTVTPASGSLAAGQSMTIIVTWNSELGLDAQLAVAPGGLAVAVSYTTPIG